MLSDRYTHSVALPPTIPTSFVPRQPVLVRKSVSGYNPFLIVSYVILGIWMLVAGLVFAYEIYLTKVAKQKSEELRTAQNNIDQATVNDFIRLRDRFTVAKDVLNKHRLPSGFFDELEVITIQNVHFTSMKLSVKDTGTATIQMQGIARNFNALAAQSTAFANDKYLKGAIFSGFTLDSKDNSVAFQVSADIDSALIDNVATPEGALKPTFVPVPTPIQTPPQNATSSVGVPAKSAPQTP